MSRKGVALNTSLIQINNISAYHNDNQVEIKNEVDITGKMNIDGFLHVNGQKNISNNENIKNDTIEVNYNISTIGDATTKPYKHSLNIISPGMKVNEEILISEKLEVTVLDLYIGNTYKFKSDSGLQDFELENDVNMRVAFEEPHERYKHQLCIKRNLSDKNQVRNKAYNNIYTDSSVWKSATEHYELVFTPTERGTFYLLNTLNLDNPPVSNINSDEHIFKVVQLNILDNVYKYGGLVTNSGLAIKKNLNVGLGVNAKNGMMFVNNTTKRVGFGTLEPTVGFDTTNLISNSNNYNDALLLPVTTEHSINLVPESAMIRYNHELNIIEGCIQNNLFEPLGLVQDADKDTRIECSILDKPNVMDFYTEDTRRLTILSTDNTLIGVNKEFPEATLDINGGLTVEEDNSTSGIDFCSDLSNNNNFLNVSIENNSLNDSILFESNGGFIKNLYNTDLIETLNNHTNYIGLDFNLKIGTTFDISSYNNSINVNGFNKINLTNKKDMTINKNYNKHIKRTYNESINSLSKDNSINNMIIKVGTNYKLTVGNNNSLYTEEITETMDMTVENTNSITYGSNTVKLSGNNNTTMNGSVTKHVQTNSNSSDSNRIINNNNILLINGSLSNTINKNYIQNIEKNLTTQMINSEETYQSNPLIPLQQKIHSIKTKEYVNESIDGDHTYSSLNNTSNYDKNFNKFTINNVTKVIDNDKTTQTKNSIYNTINDDLTVDKNLNIVIGNTLDRNINDSTDIIIKNNKKTHIDGVLHETFDLNVNKHEGSNSNTNSVNVTKNLNEITEKMSNIVVYGNFNKDIDVGSTEIYHKSKFRYSELIGHELSGPNTISYIKDDIYLTNYIKLVHKDNYKVNIQNNQYYYTFPGEFVNDSIDLETNRANDWLIFSEGVPVEQIKYNDMRRSYIIESSYESPTDKSNTDINTLKQMSYYILGPDDHDNYAIVKAFNNDNIEITDEIIKSNNYTYDLKLIIGPRKHQLHYDLTTHYVKIFNLGLKDTFLSILYINSATYITYEKQENYTNNYRNEDSSRNNMHSRFIFILADNQIEKTNSIITKANYYIYNTALDKYLVPNLPNSQNDNNNITLDVSPVKWTIESINKTDSSFVADIYNIYYVDEQNTEIKYYLYLNSNNVGLTTTVNNNTENVESKNYAFTFYYYQEYFRNILSENLTYNNQSRFNYLTKDAKTIEAVDIASEHTNIRLLDNYIPDVTDIKKNDFILIYKNTESIPGSGRNVGIFNIYNIQKNKYVCFTKNSTNSIDENTIITYDDYYNSDKCYSFIIETVLKDESNPDGDVSTDPYNFDDVSNLSIQHEKAYHTIKPYMNYLNLLEGNRHVLSLDNKNGESIAHFVEIKEHMENLDKYTYFRFINKSLSTVDSKYIKGSYNLVIQGANNKTIENEEIITIEEDSNETYKINYNNIENNITYNIYQNYNLNIDQNSVENILGNVDIEVKKDKKVNITTTNNDIYNKHIEGTTNINILGNRSVIYNTEQHNINAKQNHTLTINNNSNIHVNDDTLLTYDKDIDLHIGKNVIFDYNKNYTLDINQNKNIVIDKNNKLDILGNNNVNVLGNSSIAITLNVNKTIHNDRNEIMKKKENVNINGIKDLTITGNNTISITNNNTIFTKLNSDKNIHNNLTSSIDLNKNTTIANTLNLYIGNNNSNNIGHDSILVSQSFNETINGSLTQKVEGYVDISDNSTVQIKTDNDIILDSNGYVFINNNYSNTGVKDKGFIVEGGFYNKKDLYIGGNLRVDKNLNVLGSGFTDLNTEDIDIDDNIIILGSDTNNNNYSGIMMQNTLDNKFSGLIKKNDNTDTFGLLKNVLNDSNDTFSVTELNTIFNSQNKNNYADLYVNKLVSLDQGIMTKGTISGNKNIYVGFLYNNQDDIGAAENFIKIGSNSNITAKENKLNMSTTNRIFNISNKDSNLQNINIRSSHDYNFSVLSNLNTDIKNNMDYNLHNTLLKTVHKNTNYSYNNYNLNISHTKTENINNSITSINKLYSLEVENDNSTTIQNNYNVDINNDFDYVNGSNVTQTTNNTRVSISKDYNLVIGNDKIHNQNGSFNKTLYKSFTHTINDNSTENYSHTNVTVNDNSNIVKKSNDNKKVKQNLSIFVKNNVNKTYLDNVIHEDGHKNKTVHQENDIHLEKDLIKSVGDISKININNDSSIKINKNFTLYNNDVIEGNKNTLHVEKDSNHHYSNNYKLNINTNLHNIYNSDYNKTIHNDYKKLTYNNLVEVSGEIINNRMEHIYGNVNIICMNSNVVHNKDIKQNKNLTIQTGNYTQTIGHSIVDNKEIGLRHTINGDYNVSTDKFYKNHIDNTNVVSLGNQKSTILNNNILHIEGLYNKIIKTDSNTEIHNTTEGRKINTFSVKGNLNSVINTDLNRTINSLDTHVGGKLNKNVYENEDRQSYNKISIYNNTYDLHVDGDVNINNKNTYKHYTNTDKKTYILQDNIINVNNNESMNENIRTIKNDNNITTTDDVIKTTHMDNNKTIKLNNDLTIIQNSTSFVNNSNTLYISDNSTKTISFDYNHSVNKNVNITNKTNNSLYIEGNLNKVINKNKTSIITKDFTNVFNSNANKFTKMSYTLDVSKDFNNTIGNNRIIKIDKNVNTTIKKDKKITIKNNSNSTFGSHKINIKQDKNIDFNSNYDLGIEQKYTLNINQNSTLHILQNVNKTLYNNLERVIESGDEYAKSQTLNKLHNKEVKDDINIFNNANTFIDITNNKTQHINGKYRLSCSENINLSTNYNINIKSGTKHNINFFRDENNSDVDSNGLIRFNTGVGLHKIVSYKPKIINRNKLNSIVTQYVNGTIKPLEDDDSNPWSFNTLNVIQIEGLGSNQMDNIQELINANKDIYFKLKLPNGLYNGQIIKILVHPLFEKTFDIQNRLAQGLDTNIIIRIDNFCDVSDNEFVTVDLILNKGGMGLSLIYIHDENSGEAYWMLMNNSFAN